MIPCWNWMIFRTSNSKFLSWSSEINSSILVSNLSSCPRPNTLISLKSLAKNTPKTTIAWGSSQNPHEIGSILTPQRLAMFYGPTASSMTFTGVWFGTSKRTSKKRYRRPMAPNLGSNKNGPRETSWVPVGPISWRWGTSKNVWVTHIQTRFLQVGNWVVEQLAVIDFLF